MAASLIVTSSNPSLDDKGRTKVTLDWISHTDGTVSIDIASTYATAQAALSTYLIQPDKLEGYITSIETIPGALGVPATDPPDALYDITIDDPYNCDVMGGALGNRSATVPEKIVPPSPIPIDSELTLEIANAGNSKKGRIILSIAPSL